eukprot:1159339-Pelagomonas_calceolata.AAC.2
MGESSRKGQGWKAEQAGALPGAWPLFDINPPRSWCPGFAQLHRIIKAWMQVLRVSGSEAPLHVFVHAAAQICNS